MDMDLVESRKYLRDESLQFFQIPPEIFGIVENSNRATIDSSFFLFQKNVLSYEFSFLERAINRQLVWKEFDKELCFRFDQEIQDDEDRKLAIMNAGMTNGTVLVDEWRAAFKLAPLPDGKGQVRHLTLAMYEVGSSDQIEAQAPTKPTNNQSNDTVDDDQMDEGKPAKDEDKSIEITIVDSCDNKVTKDLFEDKSIPITIIKSNARRKAIWKSFDARATSHEPEFINAIKRYADGQEKRVKEGLKSAIDNHATLTDAVNQTLENNFNDEAHKALKRALAPAWLASMDSGRDHAYDVLGTKKSAKDVGGSFDITNDAFNAWIEKYGLQKANQINTTTCDTLRKNMQAAISDGITNGQTNAETANDLFDICDDVYGNMSTSRAILIARNETACSVNFGNHSTLSGEGVERKEWMATMDERTRDDHANADGQIVDMDDDFIIGGEKLQYPGDPSGSAEETISCRCSELPVGIGEED